MYHYNIFYFFRIISVITRIIIYNNYFNIWTAATNAVRGFAPRAANNPVRTALEILGGRSVRVSDNDLIDIGPDTTLGGLTSIGIHVGFGFEHVRLSGNRVRRATADPAPQANPSDWRAILIEDTPDFRPVAADNFALPFYVMLDANRFVAVGIARVVVAPRSQRPSVTLEGNYAVSWGGDVPVVSTTVTRGSCVFSQNQCFLLVGSGPPAVVTIAAEPMVVANNVVRRAGDLDAVQMFGKLFSVVGNISMGNIRVNGGNLPAPWNALNILFG